MIVSKNTNRHGTTYPYFICVGRHEKRTGCQLRAVRIGVVEERVEDLYAEYRLTPAEADDLRQYLTAEIEAMQDRRQDETEQLRREKARLEDERLKLLQAHYANAIPIELMKQEQDRIGSQPSALERRLARLNTRVGALTKHLEQALDYLTDLDVAYLSAAALTRRQINQAVFERIEVGDEGTTDGVPTGLYGAMLDPKLRRAARAYVEATDVAPTGPGKQHHNGQAGTTDHLRVFLTRARRAAGVKETQLAEGVGFEPTRTEWAPP
jgi:site-specific DNA recombinase